jgi:pyruvate,water dikinase
MPDELSTAIGDAYRELGGRVAVRSSATAEDLPGASFAGQQDSYLDIAGEAALLDAVRRCWASLFNDRAVAYRRANGVDESKLALACSSRLIPSPDSANARRSTPSPASATRSCPGG